MKQKVYVINKGQKATGVYKGLNFTIDSFETHVPINSAHEELKARMMGYEIKEVVRIAPETGISTVRISI